MEAGCLDAVWLVLKHNGVPQGARMWLVRKINRHARVLTDDDREWHISRPVTWSTPIGTWSCYYSVKAMSYIMSPPNDLLRVIKSFRTCFIDVNEGSHCMRPSVIFAFRWVKK